MGGASTEISDAHHRRAAGDGLVRRRWRSPARRGACGLRTEASARFERGTDPEVIDLAAAPVRRAAGARAAPRVAPGAVDVRGELPDRAPVRVRTDRVNAHARHRRSTAAEIAALARADRLRRRARRRRRATTSVTVPDAGGPTRRPRSTSIEEVARHHGYSRIARPCRRSAHAGAAHRRPAATAARSASVLVGSGLAEAMPLPFLAPGDLERCGLPDDGIDAHQPARWPRSRCCARRCCPGCSRPSPTTPPTATPASRLFEIGHVFRPAASPAQTLPDEREQLGVALAGARRDRPRSRRGASLADGARPAEAPARSRDDASPGLHPTRRRRLRGRRATAVGVVGEVDPAVLDGLRHRRAGRLARGRPRRAARRCPTAGPRTGRSAATRRATSTWPSRSTDDGRRPATSRRRCARPPATALVGRCGCSTCTGAPGMRRGPPQPGLPAAAPGPRPHPHRRRGRRGPRPLIDAVESAHAADLRALTPCGADAPRCPSLHESCTTCVCVLSR